MYSSIMIEGGGGRKELLIQNDRSASSFQHKETTNPWEHKWLILPYTIQSTYGKEQIH